MPEIWSQKIYTRQGFVRENILGNLRAIDIGCGNRKLPGAIGIDSLKLPAVDVSHNLSKFPWPFPNNNFDLALANHFLEHAEDSVATMEEIHRILKPNGRLVAQVPYFRNVDAVNDPTHRRFFSSASLDYFIEDNRLFNYAYSSARFTLIGFWYGWPHHSRNPLKRLIKSFAYSHRAWYDQYLSLILPTKCLTWELKAIKKI